MVGDRCVLLAAVPVAIDAVEAAMKCVEKAVARAVVGELAGEHGAAGDPAVVGTAGIGDDLVGRVLIAQADDRIVLRVGAQMKRGGAVLHIAAGEGVAIALLQVDAIGSADGIAAGRGAIDVQAHERAGIEPVGRGRS